MDEKVLFRTEGRAFYTDAELKKLGQVIGVFYNYLRDSERLELLWSDKAGYLLIPLEEGRHGGAKPRVIRDSGELVDALLEEISRDVAAEAGKRRLSRKEYPEYRRRVENYLAQLPEGCGQTPLLT